MSQASQANISPWAVVQSYSSQSGKLSVHGLRGLDNYEFLEKTKEGKSIEKTIERELKEELGIVVNVGEKLLSFEHAYTHKKLYFTVHICAWISGQPKPLASQKLLWVSPDRLFDFPFPAANTKIISELHKHLCIGN